MAFCKTNADTYPDTKSETMKLKVGNITNYCAEGKKGTIDNDFSWISRKERKALYNQLCKAVPKKEINVNYEYKYNLPDIKKARQFLSRDAFHRNWNGYIWDRV